MRYQNWTDYNTSLSVCHGVSKSVSGQNELNAPTDFHQIDHPGNLVTYYF